MQQKTIILYREKKTIEREFLVFLSLDLANEKRKKDSDMAFDVAYVPFSMHYIYIGMPHGAKITRTLLIRKYVV